MTCENVGEAQPDIAGIGLLVGFTGQAALSLVLATCVFFLSKLGHLDLKHEEGSIEYAIERRRLQLVTEILMVGNDIQMLTGLAYMITVFSSARTIDLYHLRLVFDTVSLVGVSNAAAMVCWSFCAAKHPSTLKPWQKPELARKDPAGIVAKRKRQFSLVLLSGRHRITYVFAIMFLALTAILGARLGDWDEESPEPGKCYKTSFVTSPSALHPQADKAYVALSAAWLLSSMFSALFGSPKQRRVVLAVAFLQFPLHLYMMIALQVANHGALEGPESEGGWDFGQTTAVLLLGVTANEFISKAWELWKWERGLKAEEVGGEGGEELQVRTQMEAPKAEGDAEVGEEFQRATG